MSIGGCLLLLRFSMKRVLILDRDSFSPATCVSTLVAKLVVVGGERNPASLGQSFRVRGQGAGREPSVSSTVLPSAGQGSGREEISHSRTGSWTQDEQGAAQAPWTSMLCRELVGQVTQHLEYCPSGCMQGVGLEERSQGRVG